MTSDQAEYGYVAYIDEGGETGLTKVRPIDENGSSEWFILSAVVMRAKWEPQVVSWVREIRDGIGIKQRPDLHYRTLSPSRKVAACARIAKLPIRGFVVASNKKNMRQHRNENAAKIPSQQWFYNCCIRLLLERVTAFCAARTQKDYGEKRPIKIEFSRCGGHRYSQTKAYHYYLALQQEGDKVYLQKRQPVRGMLKTDLCSIIRTTNGLAFSLPTSLRAPSIRPLTLADPARGQLMARWRWLPSWRGKTARSATLVLPCFRRQT